MKRESQNKAILRDLQAGQKIDPITALSRYGCFRLSARIFDIKKQGHDVQTELTQHPIEKDKRFATYFIAQE